MSGANERRDDTSAPDEGYAKREGAAHGDVSARHDAVRRANRAETAEDYVEAIEALVRERGEARVRDLSRTFGVSHVTVSRTVERLRRDGYVRTAPYKAIELTESGVALATASRERHAVVLRFLLALTVPPDAAIIDAEGIEHHVSAPTLEAFARFTEKHPLDANLECVVETLRETPTDPSRFARVRAAHASEVVEDYVEAIADLAAEGSPVRVRDLALRFGVSHVTVSRTIGRLKRDGYVETAPYKPIHLTQAGRDLALRSRERHATVLSFLLALGVPERAAEIDAEGVEHHVGEASLERFRAVSGGARDAGPDDGEP